MRGSTVAAVVLAASIHLSIAGAQEPAGPALTQEGALEMARRRAPALLAARAAVEEMRSRLTVLHPWLRDNPSVSLQAGPRWSGDERTVDLNVGLSQALEVGGRGSARLAIAQADVEQAAASAGDLERRLLGRVAVKFVAVLHAGERARVARDSERLAAESARVAERRHAGGDVGPLDTNLAAVALARARAETLAAEADREEALGELRIALDLDAAAPLAVRGELTDEPPADLERLLARAAERADLKMIEAELRRSEAELKLGRAQAWPDVGVSAGYGREEQADIARGGFTLTLPVLDRGQATRGAAQARRAALSAALDAARRAAAEEVRVAFERHALLARAVALLDEDAQPRLEENDAMARRSYEVGQLPLGELLVAQREAIAARLASVDLRRDAVLAAIELEVRAGGLR